jgi:uncharacterized protein (TIGR02391 family)
MPSVLSTIFPEPKDFFALEPEDLAGILVELIPGVSQEPGGFMLENFMTPMFPPEGSGYPPAAQGEVAVALAEAMSWLETQGIIVRNPNQQANWYLITRRGKALKTHTDVEAFREGRTLPIDLLQQQLATKVHHLFLRGDHDTAVFQAFKEVEVAVRKAGKYPDDLVGTKLMQAAFNPKDGPLTNSELVHAECLSEMFLFAGSIGHAKNPTSHRDVNITRQDAARLIVFASHLLDIVEQRSKKIR